MDTFWKCLPVKLVSWYLSVLNVSVLRGCHSLAPSSMHFASAASNVGIDILGLLGETWSKVKFDFEKCNFFSKGFSNLGASLGRVRSPVADRAIVGFWTGGAAGGVLAGDVVAVCVNFHAAPRLRGSLKGHTVVVQPSLVSEKQD